MTPKRIFEFSVRFSATLCGLLIVFAISKSEICRFIEMKTCDYRFQIKAAFNKPPRDDSIVIVGIDEKTLNKLPKPIALWDNEFSDALAAISKGRASVIGMDVLDLSIPDGGADGSAQTPLLRNEGALKKTIFPFIAEGRNIRIPYFTIEAMKNNIPISAGSNYSPEAKLVLLDVAEESGLAAGFGYANASPDNDGAIRGAELTQTRKWGNENLSSGAENKQNDSGGISENLYSFPLAIYLKYAGIPESAVVPQKHYIQIRRAFIPLRDNGGMMINFAGPSGSFKKISMIDVLENRDNLEFLAKNFQGKIVLVGASSDILGDTHVTPYFHIGGKTNTLMYGVEIVANTIHTLKTSRFVRTPAPVAQWAILFAIAVFSVFILGRIRFAAGLAFLLTTILCYLGIAYIIFDRFNLMLEVAGFVILAPLCYSLSFFCNNTILDREKRFIQKVFNRYLDPRIVAELAGKGDLSILKGQSKEVTVLFTDIRSFTSLSEKSKPETVVEILNYHLSSMTDIIVENGGMVVSYAGDAIMAIWNAPHALGDHRLRACRSALQMIEKLGDINEKINGMAIEHDWKLEIGIGINTGIAVVGNIGSERKSDYTAIGDATNVAARLESLNKELGTKIIISEAVCRNIKESLILTDLGNFQLKGKSESVEIYELKGIANE